MIHAAGNLGSVCDHFCGVRELHHGVNVSPGCLGMCFPRGYYVRCRVRGLLRGRVCGPCRFLVGFRGLQLGSALGYGCDAEVCGFSYCRPALSNAAVPASLLLSL